MSWKIGLVGTGNVSAFWALNLTKVKGVSLYVKGSNTAKTIEFSNTYGIDAEDGNSGVDCYFVCVQDRNISKVLESLDVSIPVFICAGLFSISAFTHRPIGIIYPLQTIQTQALPTIAEVPFLCEFNDKALEFSNRLLTQLSLNFTLLNEEARFASHIAAVFINNFGYFIMNKGIEHAKSHQIPLDLFQLLISKTTSNLLNNKDLQTGPARRNDLVTMEKHKGMLSGSTLELYEFLSAQIKTNYIP